MKTPIEEFAELARTRPTVLREAHKEGAKVVCYVGNYAPTELIYAAGAKPYPMWRGGEPEPPDASLEETLRFLNPLHRTAIGLHMMGLDPVSSFADLVVVSITDCHIARIAEVFEDRGLPTCKLGVPSEWQSASDFAYYKNKVELFKAKLEEITGNKITDEAILEQIEASNKVRAALRKIDELRKLPVPPIDGTTFIKLNHYATQCEPAEAVESLERIYSWLLEQVDENATSDKPRVMLIGRAVGIGDYVVTTALEKSDAVIVTEMLDEAFFRFQKDVEVEGDPSDNLCKNLYIDSVPIDNFQPSWGLRYDIAKEKMAEYNVDGVLWYQLLYDEIYDMEYCCYAKKASRDGILFTNVQTSYEYTREAMGPLMTKLETMVEAFKGGKY
ncbi:MAG: 2-hydroxyacyl-CoA dehydratase [Eggerthellaceae bacterium]|nr:2-hydroxyacyl-CoA dehydratase [Eggerthellaceae bacterium]